MRGIIAVDTRRALTSNVDKTTIIKEVEKFLGLSYHTTPEGWNSKYYPYLGVINSVDTISGVTQNWVNEFGSSPTVMDWYDIPGNAVVGRKIVLDKMRPRAEFNEGLL